MYKCSTKLYCYVIIIKIDIAFMGQQYDKTNMIQQQNQQQQSNPMHLGFTHTLPNSNTTIPIYFSPHIPQSQITKLKHCNKFNQFLHKIDNSPPEVHTHKIQVLTILMFGGDRIGYVTIKVYGNKGSIDITDYVFIRGQSICILLFVNDKLVVVEQYRVPKQKMCIEPPAGMLDQSNNIVSKTLQELREQTSIVVTKQNLVSMGSIIPNPDICDEQLFLFYCKIHLNQQKMRQIEQKKHGEQNSQQNIRVKFIDYSYETVLASGNCSFIALACAYQQYICKNKGIDHKL